MYELDLENHDDCCERLDEVLEEETEFGPWTISQAIDFLEDIAECIRNEWWDVETTGVRNLKAVEDAIEWFKEKSRHCEEFRFNEDHEIEFWPEWPL